MRLSLKRTCTAMVALCTIASLVSPLAVEAATKKIAKKKVTRYRISVSAIKGADEKDFANPTSRCLTSEMKSIYAKAVAQMDKDIKAHGAGNETAATSYKNNLETAWSAMSEPYCGYGAYGMTAVKKSFNKSMEHSRATFLAAVK